MYLPELTMEIDYRVLHEPNMMVNRIFSIISMLRISTTSTLSAYLRAALTENFAEDMVLNRGQC